MAKAVYEGIIKYDCGFDMLIYAGLIITNELNLSTIINFIPKEFTSDQGDIYSLILLLKDVYNKFGNEISKATSMSKIEDVLCKEYSIG